MIPQLQHESPVDQSQSVPEWSPAARFGFRFFFSYFLLYLGPGAVGSLNGHGTMMDTPYRSLSNAVWHRVVPWVGSNLLQMKGDFRELANGSGDQLYDWTLVLCIAVAALLAAVIWSVLDRRRTNYDRLNAWLRVLVRLSIAGPMIGYGVAKLIRAQFPEPGLARFITPLGQYSPMDLLWTFMGSSRLYSFFGGLGETLAGVLLIVPRFTALGSLLTLAVMGNVFMLNLCYDVPRKIFCLHLLLFAGYLLLPDLRRLANVFVLNRAAEPAREVGLFRDRTWNRYALLLQIAFGVAAVWSAISVCRADAAQSSAHVGPAYRGIWQVEEFTLDGMPRPPVATDKQRWQYVVLDGPAVVNVQMMDASVEHYPLQLNEQANKLKFADPNATHWKGDFAVESLQPNEIKLDGQLDNHPLSARLRRLDLSDQSKFLLINRDPRWVTAVMNGP